MDSNMFPVLAFSSKPSLVSTNWPPLPGYFVKPVLSFQKMTPTGTRGFVLVRLLLCFCRQVFNYQIKKTSKKPRRGFPCDRLLESVTGWRWMSERHPSTVGRTHCVYKRALVFVYVHVSGLVVKNQKQVWTVCFLIIIGILKQFL